IESLWGFGCWATVQSVIAGVESSGAPRAGGSVSGATNSSTSAGAFGGSRVSRCKRKPRLLPGPKTGRDGSLFRCVLLHLVFLFLLVRFVVALCFGVFLFVHWLVHLVHRFAGRLVTLGKRERRHRDTESNGEQQCEYFPHIFYAPLNVLCAHELPEIVM